ncbi:MAG: hypothetical protein CMF12_13680 [Idiomarina sp.]|uniref:excalibur calcium-binding domain-containing protein n=1 Tax=Idiomarina sp. TaxID=1874361 RepID=UPI000C506F97|nr:excalibur calcium-binding domain-containing protein [Idiomarina sp.]MBT43556.1 hypothetical protein [Idiomarina sp.]
MRLVMLQLIALVLALFVHMPSHAQERWNGLVVEPENRCAPYDKSEQYPYPQSVEDDIVRQMGGRVYGPYTGRFFQSDRMTDIEHLVSSSEGHDSGLCAAPADVKAAFSKDLLNLTLAAPEINRCGRNGKCGLDAGEWLPPRNQCWFAYRVVQVKQKYNLSVDRNEVQALSRVISQCDRFDMVIYNTENEPQKRQPPPQSTPLQRYDDNGNGRITCAEARKHGIAPVSRNHPAYRFMHDGDGDGTVCE